MSTKSLHQTNRRDWRKAKELRRNFEIAMATRDLPKVVHINADRKSNDGR